MSIRARITLYGLAVVLTVLTCFSGAIWGLVVVGLPGGQDRRLQGRAERQPTTTSSSWCWTRTGTC